jgi:hypothetical protein
LNQWENPNDFPMELDDVDPITLRELAWELRFFSGRR